MLIPLARSALLTLCTLASFAVIGRAPGAIRLQTDDIVTTLAASGRSARELRSPQTRPWNAGRS